MTIETINAKYRRDYDKLYVASMKANDDAECDRINERLAALNLWRERQIAFLAIEDADLGVKL